MTATVLASLNDRVATLMLNRPHKLNALDYGTIDTLLAHFDRIERDGGIAAVILTGSGDKAFSAGADIHEFSGSVAEGASAALEQFVRRGQRLTCRIETFPKPVIVAVNGLAFGGGCEITEAAPLAIAVQGAQFAKPEIHLAMPPTFGGTQRLPRLAGRKRALEHLLTGEPFDAERALAIGIINAIVEPGDLLDAADRLARRIIRHSPLAVRAILSAVNQGLDRHILEGLAIEADEFAALVSTEVLRSGLRQWRDRKV